MHAVTGPGRTVRLYMTDEHDCPYLVDRQARNIVVDPSYLNAEVYAELLKLGFRRSGAHVYRPHCSGCSACRSLRVPVDRFVPDRSMRRALKRNRDLRFRLVDGCYKQEYFELYRSYLQARHPGAGMDESTAQDFETFLLSEWCETVFCEVRHGNALLGVGVADVLSDALSAVYTFFDPACPARSLGTWTVLQQIEIVRQTGRKWLYLGYWLNECRKMAYKNRFRPCEVYMHGEWKSAEAPDVLLCDET